MRTVHWRTSGFASTQAARWRAAYKQSAWSKWLGQLNEHLACELVNHLLLVQQTEQECPFVRFLQTALIWYIKKSHMKLLGFWSSPNLRRLTVSSFFNRSFPSYLLLRACKIDRRGCLSPRDIPTLKSVLRAIIGKRNYKNKIERDIMYNWIKRL